MAWGNSSDQSQNNLDIFCVCDNMKTEKCMPLDFTSNSPMKWMPPTPTDSVQSVKTILTFLRSIHVSNAYSFKWNAINICGFFPCKKSKDSNGMAATPTGKNGKVENEKNVIISVHQVEQTLLFTGEYLFSLTNCIWYLRYSDTHIHFPSSILHPFFHLFVFISLLFCSLCLHFSHFIYVHGSASCAFFSFSTRNIGEINK